MCKIQEKGLEIQLETAHRVNFASAQNNIPIIKSVTLINHDEEPINNLYISLRVDPPVISPKSWTIDEVPPYAERTLSDLTTPLDIRHLRGLNETEIGEMIVSITSSGETLIKNRQHIELLARDQWGGLNEMDRLLAAYVSPNDSVVSEILKNASNLLKKDGHEDSLEGYQSDDPQRAWIIAASIWSAVTGMGLTYANPPASFEKEGQKIRGPMRIKSEGLSTCLDLALLLAAAWEAAGLNSVILFLEEHAFPGVWIIDKDFEQVTEPDVVAIRKAVQAKEFFPVEATLATKRPTVDFQEALKAGREHLSEEREHKFLLAIDIARARSARIKPLASHQPEEATGDDHIGAVPAHLPNLTDLGLLPEELVDVKPDSPKGRIERWQSKLLDLSLRNRLLNFRKTKQTVPCLVPDIGELEDALASGTKFSAYPLLEDDPIGERHVTPEDKKRIIDSAVLHAFDSGQISVQLNKREMDRRLLTLHRKAKSDLQEGGTNTLYLAAGFLRWQREGDRRIYRAPLLLVPIKLSRRSVRSKFVIQHHEDEVRFNLTLLEFLRRDFNLSLADLEGVLPKDNSGIDLPKILSYLRTQVRDVTGFEVVEELAISTFSFTKYLMWKDLVDRTDQLRSNRLVAHLIDNPEKSFSVGQPQRLRPSELDTHVAPKDILTPLPADSSQLSAILDAVNGRDFVLIGPPGTGKSQTITNVICQCLAIGKSILFVAEKAAALDVVHRRLKSRGLGDAVLELHSNKTDRRSVLSQLGRSWDRITDAQSRNWNQLNRQLRIKQDKLNTYVSELHEVGSQGFSIFDAIGWIASEKPGFTLEFPHKDLHDAEAFQNLEERVKNLDRIFNVIHDRPQLSIIDSTSWSFEWEGDILKKAQELRRNVKRLIKTSEELSEFLGIAPDNDVTPERRYLLNSIAKRIEDGAENLSQVPTLPDANLRDYIKRLRSDLNEIEKQKKLIVAEFPEGEIAKMPLGEIDVSWRSAKTKIWPLSVFARRRVRKVIETYAMTGSVSPETDIPRLVELKTRLLSLKDNPIQHLTGEARSIERATRIIEQAIAFRELLSNIQSIVTDSIRFGSVKEELEQIPTGRLKQVLEEWAMVSASTQKSAKKFAMAGGTETGDHSLPATVSNLDTLLSNRTQIHDWTTWQKECQIAKENGLGKLISAIENNNIASDLVLEFKRAYARWWLPLALDASPGLRTFAHWQRVDLIRTFRDLDKQIAEMASAEIMKRIQHDIPARDMVPRNSELGLLKHQLGLRRPSMPIRSLLENLAETFPKLAPCVLMSPLSIAQYLPAGHTSFDIVVFDEASQITTWDAVGALARGKQSIIVGDPKQLPPTNFFGRTDEEDEDGSDFLLGDMPSILEEVIGAGIPVNELKWHYRSRDETLIAFSNHFYYNNELITFPAPSTSSKALQFHKINGIYDRGATRTNDAEAKAIAGMVGRRLKTWLRWPKEKRLTLGIISFNSQQQTLILDLLDDIRRKNPELEWFFSEDREEPVIVKNLENIQGDERDVMMFSITFGPDDYGKLTMNFGALNPYGGEKRLNVAVTRARRELHIFSSITHDEIDLSRTRAVGVHNLKKFLHYAERGTTTLPKRQKDSLPDAHTPFEEAVADILRTKGWDIETQIGNSDFRVDLGIIHPDRADLYLAGIACDGVTYHRSETARDRDLIMQAVLENLNWKILRIWAVEWFHDPDSVIRRVHDKLKQILEDDRANNAATETKMEDLETEFIGSSYEPEEIQPRTTFIGDDNDESSYKAAKIEEDETELTASVSVAEKQPFPITAPNHFYESNYLPVLKQIVEEIIRQKGPMPVKCLGREVANKHGWKRTGRRIMNQVSKAMSGTETRSEFGKEFVWVTGEVQNRVPYRGLDGRQIRDVSRTEIASILDEMDGNIFNADDPHIKLARRLGIYRLSPNARAYLDKVMDWYLGES